MLVKFLLYSEKEARQHVERGNVYCEDRQGQEHLVSAVQSLGVLWRCKTTTGQWINSKKIWIYIYDEDAETA